MRWFACLLIPLALLATGCGSSVNDTNAEGPVDPALYQEAVDSNQQRLAGEDHPVQPPGIMSPLDILATGYDDLIGGPIESLWAYFNHDSAGISWRKMHDKISADHRREGALELANYKAARSNKEALLYYAYRMADDPDYTVDAAALRALNRSRAKGFTLVFVHGLNNDKPLVRTEAAKALANIPDSAAVPLLIHCLQVDDSVDVRMACADALRNYKTIEVANALVSVLDDKDFSVAWQARQSLALLTGQDFRYDENAWLSYLSKGKVFG